MGDSVQTFKAGILEIADLFVINKADREGVDLVHKDLRLLVSLGNYDEKSWQTPIVRTVATNGTGTEELLNTVQEHQEWLLKSPEGLERKKNVTRGTILKLLADSVLEEISTNSNDLFEKLVDDCVAKKEDLYSAVKILRKKL